MTDTHSFLHPQTLDDIIGQEHLLGTQKPLRLILEHSIRQSMIFFGPPGVGKTSVAQIIAQTYTGQTFFINATQHSKKDLQERLDVSRHTPILLIIDEIHRLDKGKQDILLPYLESDLLMLIGTTTANPNYALNPAIRSRVSLFEFTPIHEETISAHLKKHSERFQLSKLSPELRTKVIKQSGGDVRKTLKNLNHIRILFETDDTLSEEDALAVLGTTVHQSDKNDITHYDLLSAFQKSIRGSDVDAALHYLAKLIVSDDLESIIRRLKIIAFEDISLAYPNASNFVTLACQTALDVGFPEARIPLANAVVLLALAPKSNASYLAIEKALSDVQQQPISSIPTHIRYNHTDSKNYKYPHDYPKHTVAQEYMPKEFQSSSYFTPSAHSKLELQLYSYYYSKQ